MFKTRKSRVRLRNVVATILSLVVLSVAPYVTFVLDAFSSPTSMMALLGILGWGIDAIATVGILVYIFMEFFPKWIRQGQEEPYSRDRATLKALRADNKRLMREASEVQTLKREIASLKTRLSEFEDPVEVEPGSFVQPPR